jgi:O-antigen/teichoic acid export membrane protein
MALADQAIVSGTSFVTTVLIGRFAAMSELGLYSFASSVLIAVLCIQDSLITQPYTIERHKAVLAPAQHTGAALALGLTLSAISVLVIAGAASGAPYVGGTPELTALIWATGGAVPFFLARELCRQIEFAHLTPAKALVMDLAAAATQISALAWLGWNGHMSAVTGLSALAAGCVAAGATWFVLFRRATAYEQSRISKAAQQSWKVGKWFLANQIIVVAQANLSVWILAAFAGATEIGIYAACLSIVSLSNPMVLGLSNILLAKSAASFNEGGGIQLRRETRNYTLLLCAPMALFAVLVFLFGDEIMSLLYPAQHLANDSLILAILAAWQLVTAASIPPFYALSGMEHVRLNFWIGLTVMLVTAVLLMLLVAKWAALGAACALLAGGIVRCFARWSAFLLLCAPHGKPG